ncbi:MAG: carbohydrate ABC transporter permease, partial [Alphaproteobacteria bacterium]
MAQTRSGSKLIWDIASYAILILLAFICIFPLIWTFLTSVKV